jgi:hypothetical protein
MHHGLNGKQEDVRYGQYTWKPVLIGPQNRIRPDIPFLKIFAQPPWSHLAGKSGLVQRVKNLNSLMKSHYTCTERIAQI